MIAHLAGLAYHLPQRIVDNRELQDEQPTWDMERVAGKIGIRERHIAADDETAGDLGYAAARKLLDGMQIDRSTIDCLILCTQSPDYVLPTTACLLQDRLGLSTDVAAFDFNLGCSGYVYGLWLANALVSSGSASRVLLITAETYSKFIHPRDRSVRVLFGDGASATLIAGDGEGARLGPSVLGTDGSGAPNLIVPNGGARLRTSTGPAVERVDENGSARTDENLYMNGQELFTFTLKRVPQVVNALLARAGYTSDQIDHFVFHQANEFMNDHLRAKLKIPPERAPLFMETVGNTVSSTIPITLRESGSAFHAGEKVMLVGFGVGYSWGATMLEWGAVAMV